jgi:hypothetical protein
MGACIPGANCAAALAGVALSANALYGALGEAAAAAPRPSYGTATGEITIGNQIGAGEYKTVYTVKGDSTKVVALANSGSASELAAEANQLNQLGNAGLPVVKNYGVTTVNGQPALVMENMSGAITVKPMFNDSTVDVAYANLNSKSLIDLQKIQAYITNNSIGDFQVLVTPSGRVFINDPAGLSPGVQSSRAVKNMIADMIDAASAAKR